ncbi:MAG: DUF692 family protein [Candidatus Obscuribacterales bacterium]|nr:DUF692 family protein [Candidatus Obscuribacterales bacterium]
MPTDDFARASYALFEEGLVDTLEWSFDMAWRMKRLPDWCADLLDFFATENRLAGHGVSYSVLSSEESSWQKEYLERLADEVAMRKYLRVSEHFGYARGGPYSFNTVFPVPLTECAIACGIKNLRKLHSACAVPVGLENLAFSFCRRDVTDQGAFLCALLSGVNGYLVLDLHNVWCQMQNFDVSFEGIVSSYPLERVRELHVSGGSWSLSGEEFGRRIRRDTHDDVVPQEVAGLVQAASRLCPGLECVIYERIGNTIDGADGESRFREDFRKLKSLVESLPGNDTPVPEQAPGRSVRGGRGASIGVDNVGELTAFEHSLFTELSRDLSIEQLKASLLNNPELQTYRTYIESFEAGMIETAQLLVRKWGSSV